MRRAFRTTVPILAFLASLSFAAASPIVVGALKGASGIGMVRLFDAAPVLADGSDIKLVAVASADLMTAKLISGEYDAGVLPINVAAKLYNSGIPLRLAAVVGNGMVSFLGSDPSIASLSDIKGRTVSVAGQGATPDFLFRKLLKVAGLDPDKDLRLDYSLPYPEAAVALATGKIDFAVLPEPFATMARLKNPSLRPLLDLGKLWTKQSSRPNYPMSAFVVSAKLASERPEAVKSILGAYSASILWVLSDPKAAGALVEKADLGLKASIAEKAIPLSAYVFVSATEARPEIEALLRVFLELAPSSVGGRLPDGAFYASFD
jgi:NitT/TauT family transport system substrate-binding protein